MVESESKLKESLIECDGEKEELEIKCNTLQREKTEQSQTIRYTPETGHYNTLKSKLSPKISFGQQSINCLLKLLNITIK